MQQGEVEKKIGSARMEFIHTVTSLVLSPLNMFLREDLKVIQVCGEREREREREYALIRFANKFFDPRMNITVWKERDVV